MDFLARAGGGVAGIVLDGKLVALEGGEGIRALGVPFTAFKMPSGHGKVEQMPQFSGGGLVTELPGGGPEQRLMVEHAEGGGLHLAAVAQRTKGRGATGEVLGDVLFCEGVMPLELRCGEHLIRLKGLPRSHEPHWEGIALGHALTAPLPWIGR